jgi:hypothetical protein
MEEIIFASGSVPVAVAARVYGKTHPGFEPASYLGGYRSEKLLGVGSSLRI